jgi:hypothetical protein
VRGVADDDQIVRGDVGAAEVVSCAFEGDGAEAVALAGIVGEGTEGEVAPEPEMLELRAGAGDDVAGEKAERDVGFGVEMRKRLANAGTGERLGVVQFDAQGLDIDSIETLYAFGRCYKVALSAEEIEDPGVGAAAEIEVGERVTQAEDGECGGVHGAVAGVAGADQGAVDVPEQDLHRCRMRRTREPEAS